MSEVFQKDKRDGYYYDPIVKQYDPTFWKTVTGTPAMSGNVLRFNAAEASSYMQHIFSDIELQLTIPAAPTGGDVRQFGFRNPSSDKTGAVYFDITGTTFSIKSADNFGVVTTTTLTWLAGYTATATLFRLRWEPDQIVVLINNLKVATISNNAIPPNALCLTINNGNSDNMDLGYAAIRRAASIV